MKQQYHHKKTQPIQINNLPLLENQFGGIVLNESPISEAGCFYVKSLYISDFIIWDHTILLRGFSEIESMVLSRPLTRFTFGPLIWSAVLLACRRIPLWPFVFSHFFHFVCFGSLVLRSKIPSLVSPSQQMKITPRYRPYVDSGPYSS